MSLSPTLLLFTSQQRPAQVKAAQHSDNIAEEKNIKTGKFRIVPQTHSFSAMFEKARSPGDHPSAFTKCSRRQTISFKCDLDRFYAQRTM